jgi:hypothetical protein
LTPDLVQTLHFLKKDSSPSGQNPRVESINHYGNLTPRFSPRIFEIRVPK